jgi:signal transduction histidine kinase
VREDGGRAARAVLDAARVLLLGADERPALALGTPLRTALAGVALLLVLQLQLVTLSTLAGGGAARWWAYALAVAQPAALAVALWRPLLGWRLSFLATAATPLAVPITPELGPPPTVLLHLGAVFLLALAVPRRAVALAVALDLAALAALLVAAGVPQAGDAPIGPAVVLVLVAGLGAAVGTQRGTARRLAAAERGTAEEQARRAVLEERTRIARELHDVVAHHLSAIAVRAESAPQRVPGTAPEAAAEFGAIAGAARDALRDMRRLLGVLRADDRDRPSAPVPGVDGIPGLVDGLRGSGVAVGLEVAGTPRPVPADVGLAAFRVVQEALSNAARHAGGAQVAVRLHWLPDALRVQVDSAAGASATTDGAGTGLVGMRERVSAVGGFLVAGPSGAGHTVDATLPTGGPGR